MPIFSRRPKLASLNVPKSDALMVEDVRTPLPHTPLACSPIAVPMVMTPDTPCFDISSLKDAMSGERKSAEWNEDEDEVILSYLSHPPRPLRNTYPPDSLPPPEALDEITAQIVRSPSWPHHRSHSATRARLLELARKRIAEYQAGPKREPIFAISNAAPKVKAVRPRLGQAAFGMSRQQNSMDSLYGDEKPGTFMEALRLSNTLQTSAIDGANKDLGAVGELASPLDFTFTFKPNPIANSLPKQMPRPLLSNQPRRPSSLLQRGRSFTGSDLENMRMTSNESTTVADEPMSPPEQESIVRLASSPVSDFTTSPPSSTSSPSMSDYESPATGQGKSSVLRYDSMNALGHGTLQDVKVEREPITPLNASFFDFISPHNPASGNADGASTPAITLTADSPSMDDDTPRLLSAGTMPRPSKGADGPSSPTQALAQLSLNAKPRNPPAAPGAPRRPGRQGAPVISRSLSEGMISPPGSLVTLPHSSSLTRLTKETEVEMDGLVHKAHTLPRPMIKRQRSNIPELSVFVPRPGDKTWTDGLQSPFEHKPAGSGTGTSGTSASSSATVTPTLSAVQ